MIDGKRVVCLVPARGGSKGLPGKNVKPLCGRPLIAWTISAALAVDAIDAVVVTTDDDAIADAAHAAGARVPFRRPDALAGDDARMSDVIEHALSTLAEGGEHFDLLLLLQPTSPLRTSADIWGAFVRLAESGGRGIVSVCEAEHSPLWIGQLPEDGNMGSFIEHALARANRQQLGTYYRLNGSIYLAEIDYWRARNGFLGAETFAYVMPIEDSVDVDSPMDFEVAECLLAKRGDGSCPA